MCVPPLRHSQPYKESYTGLTMPQIHALNCFEEKFHERYIFIQVALISKATRLNSNN